MQFSILVVVLLCCISSCPEEDGYENYEFLSMALFHLFKLLLAYNYVMLWSLKNVRREVPGCLSQLSVRLSVLASGSPLSRESTRLSLSLCPFPHLHMVTLFLKSINQSIFYFLFYLFFFNQPFKIYQIYTWTRVISWDFSMTLPSQSPPLGQCSW